ncbi:MAG: hypothetical protein KF681_15850 [Bdellovibrionaceae bacterium]|nr:hypothetical protein [Pseudobdellovibrionaceae bacterium]
MALRPETQLAIQALVLGKKSQESAAQFVKSMAFVFREIKKIDQAMTKGYRVAAKRVLKKEPDLNDDEVYQKVFRRKPFMVRFIKSENKKAMFYHFLILQVSGWIKSSYAMHSRTLARHSRKQPHKWAEEFRKVGPQFNDLPWAESINIASNYVRHKEEWHFNTIEIDPVTRELRTRQNIIDTLEGDLPKKNARYLLRLGVTEDVLFGSFRDAGAETLEIIESADAASLKKNCEEWLAALNDYAQTELFSRI